MAKVKYLTEAEIIEAFVQYLIKKQGLSEGEARFGATGFPDAYSLCYLDETFVEDTQIDGVNVEVRECWTDFTMMLTFDNSKKFRFYKYIFKPEGFGGRVGEYQAAKKLYRIKRGK